MTGAGRVGCFTGFLVFTVLVSACGDSSNATHCEPNASANQQILQSLNAIVSKNPNNTGALLAHARCIYFVGDYSQAAQETSEVIRREPKQAEAYLFRARSLKMLGRISQAMQDYSTAIQLHPTADAYYGRGLTYSKEFKGKEREAVNDFTEAIKLDPKHVGAYNFRAQVYGNMDDFQHALQDAEMVLKLAPDTPNAYCNAGLAQYGIGHDQDGRKYLITCYQKDADPQTRGYYETEVNKVLYARQPRRGGGGYDSGGGVKSTYDREREREHNVYESLRNSGFYDRAEACRMDSSKC